MGKWRNLMIVVGAIIRRNKELSRMRSSMRQTRRFLMSIGGVLVVALALVYIAQGQGQLTLLKAPVAPKAPVTESPADRSPEVDAKATTEAEDQRWEQIQKDAKDGKLGTPVPKDEKNPNAHQPAPMPIETIQAQTLPYTGPIQVPQSLPSGWGSKYHVTTVWSGSVAGKDVNVYAGSKSDHPGMGADAWGKVEQGVVIVDTKKSADTPGKDNDDYTSPTRTGMLTITTVNGTCLGLTSTDGTAYTFDVAALTWATCVAVAP
jgi:hypothetical protein